MTSDLTILFAGGGSGGHLYPGIAVAEALGRILPHAKPVFLCTRREIDKTILAPTGHEVIEQPITPPRRSVGGLLRFWRNWRATHDLLRDVLNKRRPAAVLGLGGYAAGVAVKSAAKKGVPAAILNPDVIPGKANLYLMKHVRRVCCGFEATRQHVPPAVHDKLTITGCPVRPALTRPPTRDAAAARLDLDPLLRTLVVTGASQGATTVNEAVLEVFKTIKLQGWQVLHLAGPTLADKVRAEYREMNFPATVIDFTPAMADVWAVADLAVCRSGASTVAELADCGVPSILLPYPFHKDMHQLANAKVLAGAGAAEIVDDQRDRKQNAALLQPVLEKLLYDAPRRQSMAAAALTVARPDAADAVAHVLAELIGVDR